MKIIGLTAEYNPFHRGHAYQLCQIRKQFGKDCAIIVVLSGNFVQRGEPALFEAHTRAEAALRCGADLVLELPLSFATASAQGFAFGAVSVLDALGCVDELVFGSECASLEALSDVSALLSRPEYPPLLKEALSAGIGFAAARQAAAERLAGAELPLLRSRNDILGIAYLEALNTLHSSMHPCPLPRCASFPPASALRARQDFFAELPEVAAERFLLDMNAGKGPVRMSGLELALLSRLRFLPEQAWHSLPDSSEGLENRLFRAAQSAGSWEELVRICTTKRYPAARVRRMLLSAALGVTADMASTPPEYLRVLALNRRGASVLHAASPSLPVITRTGAGKRFPMLRMEAAAYGLYSLGFAPEQRNAGEFWKYPVYCETEPASDAKQPKKSPPNLTPDSCTAQHDDG